jgi:hypothetical protein
LESRALLSVAHQGVELHPLGSTKQTVIQGTILLTYTSSSDNRPPNDPTIDIESDHYSGQGAVGHLGKVTWNLLVESASGYDVDLSFLSGTLTLTTSQSATLAIEYDTAGFITNGRSATVSGVSGDVLGSMSTGQFAQDSGIFSGRVSLFDQRPRHPVAKLSFTIKLRQPAATLPSTGDVPDSRVVASPRAV